MRRSSIVVLLAAMVVTAFAGSAFAGSNFAAPLSGDEEVPAVDSRGTGVATFKVRSGDLVYKLNVANLEDILAAHIHCAEEGANGPVGVTLFGGGPVTVNGTLAQGTITAPNEGNACGWSGLADVVEAMEAGLTYVNVHTVANPPGEIRGQVR